jgi:Uma2 family endonuclease
MSVSPAPHRRGRHTYADYCSWPDTGRWELIDGVAYDMSPAPTPCHQEVVGEIHRQLANQLKGKRCKVFLAPFDVRLPERGEADEEIRTVVQPDLSVICDRGKIDGKGCRGAPDIVIEVLSPANTPKDAVRKRELFRRHGVREFWTVHPIDRIVVVHRLQENGAYATEILEGRGEIAFAAVPDLKVDFNGVYGLSDKDELVCEAPASYRIT